MPIIWTLRQLLAIKHHIFSAYELQTLIAQRTGTYIPLNVIEGLMKREVPDYVRIKTLQALCDALACDLSDFCAVTPDPPINRHKPPSA